MPAQMVSNATPWRSRNVGEKNISRYRTPAAAAIAERLVGDAVDVVGGAQAAADEVEDAEEVGEVA